MTRKFYTLKRCAQKTSTWFKYLKKTHFDYFTYLSRSLCIYVRKCVKSVTCLCHLALVYISPNFRTRRSLFNRSVPQCSRWKKYSVYSYIRISAPISSDHFWNCFIGPSCRRNIVFYWLSKLIHCVVISLDINSQKDSIRLLQIGMSPCI